MINKKKIAFRKLNVAIGAVVVLALFSALFNYYVAFNNREKIDEVKQISSYIEQVEELQLMIYNSSNYATNITFILQSDRERELLQEIQETNYPEVKKALERTMQTALTEEEAENLRNILSSFDEMLSTIQLDIVNTLGTEDAYTDGLAVAIAQEQLKALVLPQSYELTEAVEALLNENKQKASTINDQFDASMSTMIYVVPGVSLALFVVFLFMPIYIHRSITVPVVDVKDNLLQLSEGRVPDRPLEQGEDIIGEMVVALQKLNNSFTLTSEFATQIKNGNLNAKFEPMGEQDRLGVALVEMRKSLKAYSEDMERRVQERTAELVEKEKALREAYAEVQASEEEAKQYAEELESTNEALSKTLQDLQEAQAQLIQSEKMAALGQLIAGIAHEVNTPLGAIKASIGTIEESMREATVKLPKVLDMLQNDEETVFFEMVETSSKVEGHLSAREERKLKRQMTRTLEEMEIESAAVIADTFTDMKIYEAPERFEKILRHAQVDQIMDLAYHIATQRNNSKNIELAVARASKVVYALKNFARFDQSGEMVEADIRETVDTVLTIYHNKLKQGIEVQTEYDDIPRILCYPDELNQVWTNIIHNGIQAMDNSGTLDIRIKHADGHIGVTITDSGKGIPQEIQEKIFQPFFTTKPAGEGSGLGLDIVRKIIEKHEGYIDVESEPGRTSFTVFLPVRLVGDEKPQGSAQAAS